jgi:hypothetical protein
MWQKYATFSIGYGHCPSHSKKNQSEKEAYLGFLSLLSTATFYL